MNESTGADQGPMNDPMQTPTLDTTDISDSSTHRGNGRVKSIEIIGSENEKNEQYLLKTLMNLFNWLLRKHCRSIT